MQHGSSARPDVVLTELSTDRIVHCRRQMEFDGEKEALQSCHESRISVVTTTFFRFIICVAFLILALNSVARSIGDELATFGSRRCCVCSRSATANRRATAGKGRPAHVQRNV